MTQYVIVAERCEYEHPGARKVVERRAVGPYTKEQADAMLGTLQLQIDWEAWSVPLGSVPGTMTRPGHTVTSPEGVMLERAGR